MMRQAPATRSLIAVNLAVFIGGIVTGRYGTWIELYGFTGTSLLQGNLVSLVAAGFLHAGVVHLVLNMVFLYVAGRSLEPVLGSVKTVTVFFTGVVTGNIAFAALFPQQAAIGASGGVYAVLAAAMLVTPFAVVQKPFLPIPLVAVGVIYIVSAAAYMFTLQDGVAHMAHVGGAAAGSVLMFAWRPKKAQYGLVAAVIVVALLIFLGVL